MHETQSSGDHRPDWVEAFVQRLADITAVRPAPDHCCPVGDRCPFVSIIIPHYNDLEGLKLCLSMLGQQTWPRDRMEVIIADNNSSCGLSAVRDAAAGWRVVEAPIQGAGPARNAGVAAARGKVYGFIDSDCQPSARWIEEGVVALQAFDFVGGRVDICARNPQEPTAVEAWELVFGFNFKRYIQVEGYSGSGNMFTRQDVFDDVGGFRNGLAEDMDWSFRARAKGYRLGYAPDAAVKHPARPQWSDLLHRWRRVSAEHYRQTREKSCGLLRWLAWTAGMPLSIAPHVLRVLTSDQLPTWRARAGALTVLVGHRLWRTGYMTRLALTPFRPDPQL